MHRARLTVQLFMRLLGSPMSCRYTAAALYSGTDDSSSSRKRWLAGSSSAAAKSSFAATTRLALAHHVCGPASWLSQGTQAGHVVPCMRARQGPTVDCNGSCWPC